MSCDQQIHVNDINVNFVITITEDCEVIDISDATNLTIYFYKPDGTILTKTATFVTDGTDGQIKYPSVDGDLDQSGIWRIQAKIDFGAGSSYHSPIKSFKVYCNLE